MKPFSEILSTLPSIEHLQKIELHDQQGQVAAVIENKAGSQGSLKVYHYLLQKHGKIDATAAEEGLALYAEHTEDARLNPGKHPNIDRLFDVIKNNFVLQSTIS